MKSCDTQCQWHIYRMRRNIYIRTFTSRFPMIYCTSNTIYIVNESLSTNICRSIRPLMKCNDYYGSNRQPRHRHRCSPPIFHLLIWFLSVIYICNHIAIVCVFCLLTSIYSFIHSFSLEFFLEYLPFISQSVVHQKKNQPFILIEPHRLDRWVESVDFIIQRTRSSLSFIIIIIWFRCSN